PCLRPSVPFFVHFPRIGMEVMHNGVWEYVHAKTIKFGSKSIKKATFSVKKRSKTSAFRHAHLNILGVDPLWR
ncbi:MAG: hypothetical protein NTX87_00630, partial [Planctomycetota bacterium]|nr:hypothetical protein [Planctomycetota bacterium]